MKNKILISIITVLAVFSFYNTASASTVSETFTATFVGGTGWTLSPNTYSVASGDTVTFNASGSCGAPDPFYEQNNLFYFGCNSPVTFTAPADGVYYIKNQSLNTVMTLTVTTPPPPPPPPPSMSYLNTPSNFANLISANITGVLSDSGTLSLITLFAGIPLAFFVIKYLITLVSQEKGRKRKK